MSFEDKIKKWVHLDNQLKLINDKVKNIRQERNDTEKQIIEYANVNNLNNMLVNLSNEKIKIIESRQIMPLTLKYIKECLYECINNEEQANIILNYIKNNRSIKISKDIKRY